MTLSGPHGVSFALVAALFFGAGTPLAKVLLGTVDPVLLAGLLYLGSGSGLLLWRWLRCWWRVRESREAGLKRSDLPWLMSAIVTGGVIAPVSLMIGLATIPASSASLLLNLEGAFTTILAWCVFKEHYDRRLVWGMAAIAAGGLVLSWGGRLEFRSSVGTIAIVGACLAWAIDNNVTRKIAAGDPVQIAGIKGFAAGMVNLVIALVAGASLPSACLVLTAAVVGFLGYGVSLVLFILALRHIGIGTARTGAYFSLAPFVGATISILVLGDRLTPQLLVAAALMGLGTWLHLTERHEHTHWHEPCEHAHGHSHDAHHPHDYEEEPHSHPHTHPAVHHSHPHYPDIHHRHGH